MQKQNMNMTIKISHVKLTGQIKFKSNGKFKVHLTGQMNTQIIYGDIKYF